LLLTHTALDATSTATGSTTHGLVVAYPSRSAGAAPKIETLLASSFGTVMRITDAADDRVVVVLLRPDGVVAIQDAHLDGAIRLSYSDTARKFGTKRTPKAWTKIAGPLGLRVTPTTADILYDGPSKWVRTERLPFTPKRADGACRLVRTPEGTSVKPGPDGAVTLRAGAGNSAPAADAGPDVDNATVGSTVPLSGHGCDVDLDQLTPHWELVAAPAGSSWTLTNPSSWTPTLSVDAAGPYRARLTVTDGHGGTSRISDVEISGGARCSGDRLTWSDPRCG
jgi:hypothetical protein